MKLFILGFFICWAFFYLMSIVIYNLSGISTDEADDFLEKLIVGPFFPIHLLISYLVNNIDRRQ